MSNYIEKTKQDFIIENYMHYGKIVIPKGTRITHNTARGIDLSYNFVKDLTWIKRDYPTISNILKHDFTYYNYNLPSELIEKVKGV